MEMETKIIVDASEKMRNIVVMKTAMVIFDAAEKDGGGDENKHYDCDLAVAPSSFPWHSLVPVRHLLLVAVVVELQEYCYTRIHNPDVLDADAPDGGDGGGDDCEDRNVLLPSRPVAGAHSEAWIYESYYLCSSSVNVAVLLQAWR